jgi:hypothetical protein
MFWPNTLGETLRLSLTEKEGSKTKSKEKPEIT